MVRDLFHLIRDYESEFNYNNTTILNFLKKSFIINYSHTQLKN